MLPAAQRAEAQAVAMSGRSSAQALAKAPQIPSRFEPCVPETCGAGAGWRYVSVGTSHRILIGDTKMGILVPTGKGKATELSVLEFVGTGSNAMATPGNLLPSKANYFEGRDKQQWHTNVPEYDGATLQNLYPGVDVRFYYQGSRVEFDVQAEPGADLSAVRMRADKPVHVFDGGDVKLGDGDSAITIHIPAAYQLDADQHRLPVKATFSVADGRTIELKTSSLRVGLPTVVDPTIAFSTLLAQSSETSGYPDDVILTNVAVDGSGNIWVAGSAYGPFPSLATNSQLDCSASCVALGDNYVGVAFAAKFDSSGNLLVSDELGRTVDNTVGMTLDSDGNVYLDGDTEDGLSYPTTAGAFDTGATSYQLYKVFVSKIDSTGSNLVFSTLLGSTSGQTGSTNLETQPASVGNNASQSIAVDSQGNVYVGGFTQASDFPVTANAIKSTCGVSTCPGWNGFVTEFNPTGSGLVYSTLFGGSGTGTQVSQLLLAAGKIIVSGVTQDTTFPVSATAIHRTMGSCDLAGAGQSDYLSSIDPTKSGSAGLVFSTFICEEIQSMALDSQNDIYLGVITPAGTNNTPPTPGSFVTLLPNTACNTPECTIPILYPGIAIEEISADGSQVLKMSYLDTPSQAGSGSALDSIALDTSNNVYVSGHIWVDTSGVPIANGVQSYLGTVDECNGNTWEAAGDSKPACSGLFLMKLDPQLDAPIFATVYGPQNGSVNDGVGTVPSWLAIDRTGNIYAAGWEELISWPTGTFQNGGIGTQEGYLLKIAGVPANPGVLLTSDHLLFSAWNTNPITYAWEVSNNYNVSSTQTVTVVNHSGSTIQIDSIKGDGTTTDPLSASQNCLGALDDGSSCSVTVSFTPQVPGNLTGTITITDTSSTSPHVITGIGTGYMGQGQPASTSLTFPATAVGQSSAAQTLLFNNTGNLTLNVSSITATGDFSETDNCSGGINVGTSCAINVTFKPTSAGTRTGTLSITDDGAASPHIVTLTGTGSGSAVSISPSSVTFASQTTGTTSAAQKVTLTNAGTSGLSITSIAASGDFGETNTCGTSMAAGASCIISVTFTPTASGTRTGTLSITDDAQGSPQTVSLTGTGATPASVTLSPVSLTFASQTQGTTSAAQTVTLTDSGSSALSLTSIATSGDFAETNNCGSSVAGGASCTISVTFTPTASGTRTGKLTVTDNASGSPQTVTLSGTGTAQAGVTLSPTSLNFASQTKGTTSAAQVVTLTNSSQAALSITTIAASGDFAETNTCGASMAGGASCAISVTFTPTSSGTRTGTLTITDNASGSPQTVSLSGTGTTPASATVSPTSLTFTAQAQGTTSTAQTVTLTNSGQSALSITSIAASGDFAETNTCGASVAAGANCTISLTFTPTAGGTRVGTLTITDNAGGSPQTVALTGSGVTPSPAVSVTPTSLTFAAQNTGSTSAAQTITLANTGSAALSITSIAASGDFAETSTCGSSLAAGANCTISVTFTPAAGGSRTGTLTVTDNAGGSPQTVSLTGIGSTVTEAPSSSSLTISASGGSTTDSIQLSPAGGFTGTVNLTCTITYQGSGSATDAPTCSLSPAQAQVASGSTVSTTLTIATTASGSAHLFNPFPPIGGGALAAVLFFIGAPRRRWRGWSLLAVLGVVIAGTCLGCGGSNGGGSGNNPPPNPGTTTGNYSVTVEATSGTMVSSVSIPLNVQ